MSQVNDESVNGTPAQEQEEFDEGFAFGDGEAAGSDDALRDKPSDEPQQPRDTPLSNTADLPASPAPPVYPAQAAPQESVPAQAAPAPAAQDPAQHAAKTVPAPEEIAEELESLKKLNPEAAALALEDSAEGASVRARLEQYGADIAQDRAEQVIYQRRQEEQARKTETVRAMQARDAHNAAFMSTLRRDHPEYTAMITDPSRKAEAVQYQQDVFAWIAAKPYSEAAALMDIARTGRDPVQVSALLKRFESERGKVPKQPDPTGALAVPGRGAPAAPAGIGDKGDFDAGWNANPSK